MLPNEVFALACRAYYEEQGLIVDGKNGQFAHCPLPKEMGETGYYLLWEHHQHQGLLQSRDVGKICFWVGDARKWLTTCNYWPDDYFELWDIYEEFAHKQGIENIKKAHTKADRSYMAENGRRNFNAFHERRKKDPELNKAFMELLRENGRKAGPINGLKNRGRRYSPEVNAKKASHKKDNPLWGKVRITNGVINTQINADEPIPEGFWRGLTRNNKKVRETEPLTP